MLELKKNIDRVTRLARISGLGMLLVISVAINDVAGQGLTSDDLFSVSFPTEQKGWACGRWGTIVHSSDGGSTWSRQKSGCDYTLSAIFFVDAQKGWAVGNRGTILSTNDGGKNWIPKKSPVPFYLMDVHFLNSFKGFIVTERTHILITEDGGETWTIQFSDEDYILHAVSFSDALNGWAVGEYGYIYHTKDGGNKWEKQAGFFDFSEETGDPIGDPFLFDVVALDVKTAWAVGIDGTVLRTQDAGKTWKKIKIGTPQIPLFGIAGRGDHLLIAGRGTVLSSTDRGENWQTLKVDADLSYGWVYGVTHIAGDRFALSGWEGRIYTNLDGSWEKSGYQMID